jgi:glycolate oxidase
MSTEHWFQAFSKLLPKERFLTQPAQIVPYESDALTAYRSQPKAVTIPENQEEVIQIVRLCYEHKIPFVARGSGTSLSGGSLPVKDGIVIALNRLNLLVYIMLLIPPASLSPRSAAILHSTLVGRIVSRMA